MPALERQCFVGILHVEVFPSAQVATPTGESMQQHAHTNALTNDRVINKWIANVLMVRLGELTVLKRNIHVTLLPATVHKCVHNNLLCPQVGDRIHEYLNKISQSDIIIRTALVVVK